MSSLNILISGAGVAGPALAFWLNRLGHKVTVVEYSPTLRTGGQQIDCRAQGIQVIRHMGLEQAIRDVCVDEDGMAILDYNGKSRAVFLANKSGKGSQAFTSEFEIMRGDLCRVLYDATKDRTTYKFGVSVTSFDQSDSSSVTVHFSDNTSASYDLLVGADGQNSRLRRQMLGADAPNSFHSLGLFAAFFSIPRTPQPEAQKLMKAMQIPNRRAAMTRCDNRADLMQAYLFTMPSTEDGQERLRNILKQDIAAQKAALAEDFADVAEWEVPRILQGAKTTPDFYMQEIGQVKTHTWSKGRVNYDATLRPFVNEIQKISPLALKLIFAKSTTAIWFTQTIMSVASTLRIDKFFQAVLPEERGGWVLPEYPAFSESAPVASS
ncbi:putative monooxygenase [Mycena leptocephala]|nr:putative monooxygenase [Mycena leptocephala]